MSLLCASKLKYKYFIYIRGMIRVFQYILVFLLGDYGLAMLVRDPLTATRQTLPGIHRLTYYRSPIPKIFHFHGFSFLRDYGLAMLVRDPLGGCPANSPGYSSVNVLPVPDSPIFHFHGFSILRDYGLAMLVRDPLGGCPAKPGRSRLSAGRLFICTGFL